jgi:hypothetical protein
MNAHFQLVTALIQLISLFMTILVIYTLISVVKYIRWKKDSDIELHRKMDNLLEFLGKQSQNQGNYHDNHD